MWSSELAKLASNAMLAQRISSINSLSALCEKTGADIDELSKAIGMDDRIGPHFLKASVGFGGSCFKKDILNLVYLCKHYGLNEISEYWHQVIKINEYQKIRFAENIINFYGNNLNGIKIAVLGWAFKANTNDSRESASIKVVEKLYEKGAEITVYDPLVPINQINEDIRNFWKINLSNKNLKVTKENLSNFNCSRYDCVVIITEWKEFENLNFGDISIFDGRRIIKNNNVTFKIGS